MVIRSSGLWRSLLAGKTGNTGSAGDRQPQGRRGRFVTAALLLGIGLFAAATVQAEQDDAPEEPLNWAQRYQRMDVGPFYGGVVRIPDVGDTPNGVSIRVGERQQATICFDADRLRISAGWDGFLNFISTGDYGIRNNPPPTAEGTVRFSTPDVTGWIDAEHSRFTDTRGRRYGPVPEEQGRYLGLHLNGRRVVLSYEVRGVGILESPWYVETDSAGAFARDLALEPTTQGLAMLLFQKEGEMRTASRGPMRFMLVERDGQITAAAIRAHAGMELAAYRGQVGLRLEPHPRPRSLRVLIWQGSAEQFEQFQALASQNARPDDVRTLAQPGDWLWGEPLVTRGRLGRSQGGFAMDALPPPRDNPFNALTLFSGLDFLPDGRAVVSSLHGDVWIVEGIDDSLRELRWQRFATGLDNPMGVRVVDGQIYVSCEASLVRLHDRNGNGEADFYENFVDLVAPGPGAWRQAFGLEVDNEGNFYFGRGRGHWHISHPNAVWRVSPDGKLEAVGVGLRQPFGIGISPGGRMTVSTQEGPWVPQTPVHKIDLETRKGEFYGYSPNQHRRQDPYPREIGYEPPIVWIPRSLDTSGGGQVWVPSDNWALPPGKMIHLSWGQRTLLHLMYEQVDGDWQGGVVPLPVRPALGNPRVARFHPIDGQMYVVGFGWGNQGGLERVRYTGEPVHLPLAIHAHQNGVRIRFTDPLDPAVASSVDHYTVHWWNYRWDDNYGSPPYSLKNPDEQGEDPVAVRSVVVSDDGREVFLEIPDMITVMQMRIAYRLRAADGTEMEQQIHSTVNALGAAFEP